MGRSRWISERWIVVGPWSKEKAKLIHQKKKKKGKVTKAAVGPCK
jgi:hypothetical protein